MTSITRTTGKDDVRAGILNASLQLMNEGGLGALSMREVARRAGVSHQAPYHYFQDREAILAELAGEGFDQLYDYMVSAVGLVRDRQSRNRAMGEAYIRFALNHPELFRLMFRTEMCDLSAYPEAKAKAERCFNLPVEVLGVAGKMEDKANPDLTPVIASWSIAHGLATLLLEGKLGGSFGETRDQREAGANRIIAFFAEKLAK
ncbi:MAG: TetR/AcrR family transcriptional regulator [Alphaproteobacteria bacterium]|jgi:AcrR family transcriptional regulator|nr:MAG: TetR/AcrR family transcriptional regulator [Alphaproteobacteria bacterium]